MSRAVRSGRRLVSRPPSSVAEGILGIVRHALLEQAAVEPVDEVEIAAAHDLVDMAAGHVAAEIALDLGAHQAIAQAAPILDDVDEQEMRQQPRNRRGIERRARRRVALAAQPVPVKVELAQPLIGDVRQQLHDPSRGDSSPRR